MKQLAINNPAALRVKVMLDTTTYRMMTDYCDALVALVARFQRATNERDGKDAFREDIVKLESDMHVILAAGWNGYLLAGGYTPARCCDCLPNLPYSGPDLGDDF